jgi:DNA-binding helix-hairpin-helix protein with protein kinase domain
MNTATLERPTTGTAVFIVLPGKSARERVALGERIGAGLEAAVYDVAGWNECAAKIYHQPRPQRQRAKIEAMLANPPEHLFAKVSASRVPLLAWPTHIVEDEEHGFHGFLMRKMPVADSVSLTAYLRGGTPKNPVSDADRSLPSRLQLCWNLCGVLADLHRQGHFIIDFKPQNVRLFKHSCIPCILDTDGCSIRSGDGQRFPAHAYTPEFASPELLAGSAARVVDDRPDRFSLAVLLFEILNNGIHPFQGILHVEREPNTYEQGIREGQYAYGLAPHPQIDPTAISMHHCLPRTTRQMFDDAFQSTSPEGRPTALQWRDHFKALRGASATFEKCGLQPDHVMHIHFSALPCPQCRSEAIVSDFGNSVSPGLSSILPDSRLEHSGFGGSASAPSSPPPPRTPTSAQRARRRWKRVALILMAAIALWMLARQAGRIAGIASAPATGRPGSAIRAIAEAPRATGDATPPNSLPPHVEPTA